MFYNFPDVIMYRREVSNVPGGLVDGEVGAGDLMEALWLRLEEENGANNDGQEEEESGDDGEDEEVGGSCSNPEEEMNESEEDSEEDPPGLIQEEDEDQDEVMDHDQEHCHVGRAKRITRERITVGDTMNDDDYR